MHMKGLWNTIASLILFLMLCSTGCAKTTTVLTPIEVPVEKYLWCFGESNSTEGCEERTERTFAVTVERKPGWLECINWSNILSNPNFLSILATGKPAQTINAPMVSPGRIWSCP